MAEHLRATDLCIPKFHRILADAFAEDGHSEYWMRGGRGSTKSSFISLCIVLLIVHFPFANATVMRRVSATLRNTVFNQMQWAIDSLGLSAYFRATVSPMEITYLPTGQKMVFVGLDDPTKVKGTVFTTGYGAVQWFEEVDQLDGWEQVSNILRTMRRGGDRFWTFYSYNPPMTMWSWVNSKALEMERKDSCLVDHSTYLDVVDGGHADWLGSAFIEDAEYEREEHPRHYQWEFLGEVTGTGGTVFENLREVHLTDAEIRTFDNFRNGVDWGWFPDPWRFVRCEWQPGRRRLVIFDERSANKTTPEDTARMAMDALTYADADGAEAYYHAQRVLCDDANPADIAVYRRVGVRASAAGKGNMRKPSYQWLAGLREIAIDPARCPLTWQEFALCEYERDRDGNWVDDYPDGNDHSIDAVRYAMMREVQRGR